MVLNLGYNQNNLRGFKNYQCWDLTIKPEWGGLVGGGGRAGIRIFKNVLKDTKAQPELIITEHARVCVCGRGGGGGEEDGKGRKRTRDKKMAERKSQKN